MPKQVDHERRRAQIVDAACRLIAERGLGAVTMRGISASLGLANGALRHYFPGKDAIVEAAVLHVVAETEACVARRVGGLRGLAAVRASCRAVLPHDEATERAARVMIVFRQRVPTGSGPDSALAAATARWRARLSGHLKDARRAGEICSSVPTEVLVEQVSALVLGLGMQASATSGAALLDGFLAGLAAGDPGRSPERAQRDGDEPQGFLSFAGIAPDRTGERLPDTDRAAMTLVLLLHRVTSSVVYDLESTVHRPAGWSWSAFRLLFTLWISGEQEAGRMAELSGMSRAAVSSLAKTLASGGLVERRPAPDDRRVVHLVLTEQGASRLRGAFRVHNRREVEWSRLLPPDDLSTLNVLLERLARAAQQADWINRRS